MANIWFTSDQHFGHKNVLKLSNRPYSSIEQMDEDIIEKYNKLVKKDDVVYFLGDLAWNQSYDNYKKIFKRLNGRKVYILGNHDNRQNLLKCQKDGLLLSVKESQILNIGSDTVHLTHYPLLEWFNFYHGGLALHGHTHCRVNDYCLSTDIGVDCWEMEPVEFTEIKEYLTKNGTENSHYI